MYRQALLIAIIAAGIAFTYGGDDVTTVSPQPEITTAATLPPATITTTTPTTTDSTITTTTPTTNTTTTTKTTTTSATTTTATTSIAPNTTTSTPSPPTTTVPPPEPKSRVGKWNVTDSSTNTTCIMIHMAIMLNVTYMNTQNKTTYAPVYVPVNSTASGACGNETENIILKWGIDAGNSINMWFKMNATEKHFKLSAIDVTIVPTDFPDIIDKKVIIMNTSESHFSTAVNKSYFCIKEQTIDLMKKDTNETQAKMTLGHVQLQAFHSKNDTKFGDAQDCESSSTPDIVPIAVGCALVGLVAVVLIAYLVGRRRSQARGYLSM